MVKRYQLAGFYFISKGVRSMETIHCIENYDTVVYLLITKESVLSMKT